MDRKLINYLPPVLRDVTEFKANITGNSFTVTFAALTGLVVTGVWNETYQRVEF